MTHSVHSARKQFFVTFAKTLKKNAFHTVLLFLFMLVSLNAYNVSVHYDMNAIYYYDTLPQIKYIVGGMYIDSFLIAVNCLVLGVSAILLSVYNFRFMHTKKTVNVYYSLGVSRATLFAGKFVGCVVSQLIGVALPFLICGIYNVYLYGSSPELWQAIVYYGASMTALALYPFAVCVLCMTFSGSTVESLVCGGLLTFTPSALYYGTYLFSELFLSGAKFFTFVRLKGFDDVRVESAFGGRFIFADFLYPVTNYDFGDALAQEYTRPVPEFPSIGYPVLYLGLFVLLGVAARFSFVYGKTERATFLGSCPRLIAVTVFALGSILIPAGALIVREYGFTVVATAFCAILLIGVAFGLFVGIIAILLRSKAKIKAQLRTGGIMAAALLVFMFIFITGGFGFEKRIPETEKITAAGITFNSAPGVVSNSGYYIYKGDNRDLYEGHDPDYQADRFLEAYLQTEGIWGEGSFVYFEDEQSIDTIRTVHELLINDRRNTYNSSYYGSVMVSYKLANGRELTRIYNHTPIEAMVQLQGLLDTEDYREAVVAELMSYFDGYEHNNLMLFSKNCTAMTDVVLEDKDRAVQKDLFNAILADIRSGNLPLDFESDTAPLGYITLNHFDEAEAKRIKEPVYHITYSYDYPFVPVFSSMTETLAVLQSAQKLQYFEDVRTPVHARIYENPLNNESKEELFARKRIQTLQFNGFIADPDYYSEFDPESVMLVPFDTVTVEDPALLKELCEQTYFSYFVNEPGYFVQLHYSDEDGRITDALVYVPADKLPAALK